MKWNLEFHGPSHSIQKMKSFQWSQHHSGFFNFTQGSTGCIASPENIRQFEHLHTCFIRMSKGPRSSTSMYSRFWLVIAFLTSRIRTNKVSGQCHTAEYSVRGMYLRGHTFKNVQVELPETCYFKCTEEVTCQSYNFVIRQNICELNNRTKEARPEDFLPDKTRYYMRRLNNRGYHIKREVLRISVSQTTKLFYELPISRSDTLSTKL